MTGNWPCYRFLQIEAWNACRIFYSLGLARPLQVSKKIFWDILSKIRFRSFVGLDLENRLSTHNMVISFELKAKKNIWWKNQKTFFECPFEIIGFICWLTKKFQNWILNNLSTFISPAGALKVLKKQISWIQDFYNKWQRCGMDDNLFYIWYTCPKSFAKHTKIT